MSDNVYDLEQRTHDFSLDIIRFLKTIKQDTISRPLIDQLVRSATSVGANYREANGAISRKDFATKIFICKKEAKEAHYWLNLIGEFCVDSEWYADLKKECHELVLIFSKIACSAKEQ